MKNLINALAKKTLFSQLARLTYGQLQIEEDGRHYKFGLGSQIKAMITVHHPSFYSDILFGGSIGSSESFIRGAWDTKDLTKVIQLMAVNNQIMDQVEGPFKKILSPFLRFAHFLNRNTQEGSKKNISRHYDLSNKFFSLFLDSTMMYSSAIYRNDSMSLEDASKNKLDIICNKLKLKKTDRVVEIGSGWGGFSIYAAKKYGCHVTTTTISKEQYRYVKEQIKLLGMQKNITVLLKDYRDLKGQFDKLVSIEMIEAVGHQYYNQYFSVISKLLKNDGEALIQAITITDQRYDEAIQSVDFIQKYIFPGSCIPSLTAIQKSLTGATDLVINNVEDIGIHYAKTLKDWREKFIKNEDQIMALGFDKRFMRMWLFYLCYCEGGFIERSISDLHIHISKPLYRDSI